MIHFTLARTEDGENARKLYLSRGGIRGCHVGSVYWDWNKGKWVGYCYLTPHSWILHKSQRFVRAALEDSVRCAIVEMAAELGGGIGDEQ